MDEGVTVLGRRGTSCGEGTTNFLLERTNFLWNKLPLKTAAISRICCWCCHHHRSELKLNSTVSKLHTTVVVQRAVCKKDLLLSVLRGFEFKSIYRFLNSSHIIDCYCPFFQTHQSVSSPPSPISHPSAFEHC